MSGEILSVLIQTTLAMSAAIIVILALRVPTRSAFGMRAAYALWLLAPISAIASLLPTRTIIVESPISTAPIHESIAFEAAAFIVAIWIAGVVLMLAALFLRYRRLLTRLYAPIDHGEFLRADGVGPAVVGVLRPRIVLPIDFERRYTEAERELVLEHERVHLRSYDVQINAAAAFLQCLAWFNPLVHIACTFLRIDQELACDECVMARYAQARRPYAEAILKAQIAAGLIVLGCRWPSLGGRALKERITMLARPHVGSVRVRTGVMLSVGLSIIASTVAWAGQPPRLVVVAGLTLTDPISELRDADSAERDLRWNGREDDRDAERNARRAARDEERIADRIERALGQAEALRLAGEDEPH